jgi:hypothetical protein
MKKIFLFIAGLFYRPLNEIMLVDVDLQNHRLHLFNWYGQKILNKKFSETLFKKIKPFCKFDGEVVTKIFIWTDEKTFLAYSEPIENYFNDTSLLYTGQGFSSESGIKYGDACKLKCPSCGQYYK